MLRGGAENAVTARKLEGLVRNAGDAVPEVAAGPADPGFPHSSRLEARLALPGQVARFFTAELKALLPAPLLGHWNQPMSLLPIITYAPFFDRGLKYVVQFD